VFFGDRIFGAGGTNGGTLTASGYDPLLLAPSAWMLAFDADCAPAWDAIRSLTGLGDHMALASVGVGGEESLLVASSDGSDVDDGAERVEGPGPGEHAFVELVDGSGLRVAAGFHDVPIGELPRLAALPGGDVVLSPGFDAGVVLGLEMPLGDVLWEQSLPADTSVSFLLADARGVVTVLGLLGEGIADFDGSSVVVDAAQAPAIYYWDFEPPN
jgi:hypothetical protein